MGYLPAGLLNYLARLGWSHGNDEFFTTEQAIAWFDLSHLGKAPARFDFGKLEALFTAIVAHGDAVACGRLRRTLAGALVTLDRDRLVVNRAPPRRQLGPD